MYGEIYLTDQMYGGIYLTDKKKNGEIYLID